jgi:hypothetical protein
VWVSLTKHFLVTVLPNTYHTECTKYCCYHIRVYRAGRRSASFKFSVNCSV